MPVSSMIDLLDPPLSNQERVKGVISSIANTVNSYDDEFSQFQELIQNALDSLEAEFNRRNINAVGQEWVPQLVVKVEEIEARITVIDNGIGIDPKKLHLVLAPNQSEKPYPDHPGTRGHKGAAMAYLQFGHSDFLIQSKHQSGVLSHQMAKGYETLQKMVEDPQEPFPVPVTQQTIDKDLDCYESGVKISVQLRQDHRDIWNGFFQKANIKPGPTTQKTAHKRFGFLLKTRTGVGYVSDTGPKVSLGAFWQALKIQLFIDSRGCQGTSYPIDPGYLYPHEFMCKGERATAVTAMGPSAVHLIWETVNQQNLAAYSQGEKLVTSIPKHAGNIRDFDINGYWCVANRNTAYEEMIEEYCEFPPKVKNSAANLPSNEQILAAYFKDNCCNAGIVHAHEGFPNGHRINSLTRTGSEWTSRVFLLVNFHNPYKNDTGRKTLSEKVKFTVREMERAYTQIAATKSGSLVSDGTTVPHQGTNLASAKQVLLNNFNDLKDQYTVNNQPLSSGNSPPFFIRPKHENDVVVEFAHLVAIGKLPGFKVYGFPGSRYMLDAPFDFYATADATFSYDPKTNPLGLKFSGAPDLTRQQLWMEFKVDLADATKDFQSKTGTGGKKFFETVNLIVCETTSLNRNTAFSVQEIDTSNVDEREYYGVTHILSSSTAVNHKVQVISLEHLRPHFFANSGMSGEGYT